MNKMQIQSIKFTKNDLAKYPFLKAAIKYIKLSNLKIEDLIKPELSEILKRAQERVIEAILYTKINRILLREDIEIASYPAAVILVLATKNSFIKKRYALAEAKTVFEDLKEESIDKILYFAQNFQIRLTINKNTKIKYEFKLPFVDYVRNTSYIQDRKWKLVNRLLLEGYVYLTRTETARLLSEEVRKHLEKKFETTNKSKFPEKLIEIADKIKKLALEKIGKVEMEDIPKIIVENAFPPCIMSLLDSVKNRRHLSHVGRFTLTAFLINIGMTPEKVTEMFRNFSDFNEKMTRYQVEHIAGYLGSRILYKPPRCSVLKTHSVCINPNNLCKIIPHPLLYYIKKRQINNKK
jgi:DNA primase large subunit